MKRRTFVGATGAALVASPAAWAHAIRRQLRSPSKVRFGMVTYLWGRDLDLVSLLQACEAAKLEGVELRTTHAHGVERTLSKKQRRDVRAQFDDAPVACVGIGSNERFDSPDQATLAHAMAATREFLKLSAAIGGSGVKVKPDRFHKGIEHAVTIEQIGRSLAELAPFAEDLAQELRLEVHGDGQDPAIIAQIIAEADHPAVKVCWNSNARDVRGRGFAAHYDQLRPSFGATVHCRELDTPEYPSIDLIERLVDDGYSGTVLLEAHSSPPRSRVSALKTQRAIFDAYASPIERRASKGISIAPQRRDATKIDVVHNGELFATCRIGEENPCLYPLNAVGNRLVVRGYPFVHHAGEARDHPHHRACWFAHGDVDSHDFWHDKNCTIRVKEHSIDGARLWWVAEWASSDGPLATEERTMTFSGDDTTRTIDFSFILRPLGDALTFGDTKEGTFALRVSPTLRLKGARARGRIENARGERDGDCWGKRAASVLYEGPIDGRLVRLSISDDQENPRHPTWWHARDYGLFAANPFGKRAFEGGEAMPMRITNDEPLRLKYTLELASGAAVNRTSPTRQGGFQSRRR